MSDPNPARCPRWAWLVLGAILVLDVWYRGHTFGPALRDRLGLDLWPASGAESEPLDCDEAAYAYIGRRIVGGAVMYRDLTENKPPGGYWLYALAVATGGADELAIRLLPVPMVLASIALVWVWLRLRGPGAACLAALIYAIASTDPYVFGNGSNFEHAINLFATAALALFVGAWNRPGRLLLLAAGASLGAACLVKQVAILHLFVFGTALLCRCRPWSGRLLDVSALSIGFALTWGIAVLVLVLQGAGPAAFDDIVRYGSALARETPAEPNSPPGWVRWFTGNADPRGTLPWPFGRTSYLVWWGTGTWPLWLLAIPSGLGMLARRSHTAERRVTAGWTASAWLQVALPGLYWPHYYLLPLPGLAVAIAVSLADAIASNGKERAKAVPRILWVGLVSVALAWTLRIQVRDYLFVPPRELTVRYKGGQQWVTLRALGRDLARRSRIWPSPRLYVWGWQSPLYFYSGLDGVSRNLFVDNLLKAFAGSEHPLIKPRVDRILHDLERRPPELVFVGYPPFPALLRFLEERYLPSHLVPATVDGRGLWVARGGYLTFESLDPPRSRLPGEGRSAR